MRFAAIRNRNTERFLALLSAVALFATVMVVFAEPALAHHPVIDADDRCDDQGVLQLSITSRSWTSSSSEAGNHSDVHVEVQLPGSSSWTFVGEGAYTEANGRMFTINLSGSSAIGSTTLGALEGETIGIRAQVQDVNGDASGVGWTYNSGATNDAGSGNGNAESSMELTLLDCEPPPPTQTTFSIEGVCDLDEDEASYTIEGELGDGLTLQVGGETVSEDGEFSIEVDDAGNYPYSVQVAGGYVLADNAPPAQGSVDIEDCAPTTTNFNIGGSCEVVEGEAQYTISGNLGDGLTLEVAGEVIDEAGPFSIQTDSTSNAYEVTVDEDYVLDDGAPPVEGSVDIEDCTPPPPPSGWVCIDRDAVLVADVSNIPPEDVYDTREEALASPDCQEVQAAIIVTIDSSCEVVQGTPTGLIEVTMSVAGGADVVVRNSGGVVVGTLSADGTINATPGATYTWEATPNEGFQFPVGFVSSGSVTVDTCDEVRASVLVTVSGACIPDGDEGIGRITVNMSVDGAANVVVRDSDGDVVGTRSTSGTITVPEGDTYTWVATANEGFEFPVDFNPTGQVTVDTCSEDEELPFTGIDSEVALAIAIMMMVAGWLLVRSVRNGPEETH